MSQPRGAPMTLSGRKVLITGANRGLGASFVEAALARQASAVYAGARDPALLPRFSDPARVVPVRLDVTDAHEVTAAGARADRRRPADLKRRGDLPRTGARRR